VTAVVLPPSSPYFGAGALVSGAATTLTPGFPAGVRANDVAILVVTSQAQSIALTTANGFASVVAAVTAGSGATGISVETFWSRLSSSSPSSPVVTANTLNQTAQIFVFRGCSRDANPYDVTATNTQTSTTVVSVTGATSLQQYETIACIAAYNVLSATPQSSTWTNSNLTGLTLQSDTSTLLGGGIAIATGEGVNGSTGSAAYGATTATLATSSNVASISIALKPAWTVDAATGSSPKVFPYGPNEWIDFLTAAGLGNWSAPNIINGCQDSASPLADQSGNGFTMVAAGTGISYQGTLTGYSRKGVNFTTGDSGNFSNSSTSLPNLSSASFMHLLIANVTAPGAARGLMNLGPGSSSSQVTFTSTNKVEVFSGASGVNHATGSASPTGSWQAYVNQSNFTTTLTNVYDNLESLTVSNSGVSGQLIRFGVTNAEQLSPTMTVSYHVAWFGAAAERSTQDIFDMQSCLGWSPTYNVPTQVLGVPENVGAPTDSVGRTFVGARVISESVVIPSDAVVRFFVGGRSMNESISTPTDSVSRSVAYSRSISENVGAPTDVVVRAFTGHRSTSESVSAPTDSVVRNIAGIRVVSESVVAPTDSVARVFSGARSISDGVVAPADSVQRRFIGVRTLAESMSAPNDVVSTVSQSNRVIVENVTAPTDVVVGDRGYHRVFSENIAAPADSVVRAFAGTRSVVENVGGVSDVVVRDLGTMRSVSELVLAPADVVEGSRGYYRTISENVPSPTDAVARALTGSTKLNLTSTIMESGELSSVLTETGELDGKLS
jgi:hypothetical protein